MLVDGGALMLGHGIFEGIDCVELIDKFLDF
jgi:hypothetical protein